MTVLGSDEASVAKVRRATDLVHRRLKLPPGITLEEARKLGAETLVHVGVLSGCLARKISGPGFPGGLIIYFPEKDTYVGAFSGLSSGKELE